MDAQNKTNQHHQNDLNHEQAMQQCQLCSKKVKIEQTYAGPFNRICKKCSAEQVDHLMEPIHLISQGIYIGSQQAPRNQKLLKQHKISAICTCGPELRLHDYEQIKVQRKVIKILDTANQKIINQFPQAVQWIAQMRKQNRNVLVHCAGGVSRSASICISYFMKQNKMPYQQSYLHVKRARKCIKPNQNFVQQLKNYEKQLM